MKTNVCIVALNKKFAKDIAQLFSGRAEMFFADIDDLIQFDIIDLERAQQLCGDQYVTKISNSKVRNVSTYQNTCYTLNYFMLNEESNLKAIKQTSILIYLQQSKAQYSKGLPKDDKCKNKNSMDVEMFAIRDKTLMDMSDIVVKCSRGTLGEIVDNVMQNIVKYYNKKAH